MTKLLTVLSAAALSAAPFLSNAQYTTHANIAATSKAPACGIPFTSNGTQYFVDGANTGPSNTYVDNQLGSPYFGYVFYLYQEPVPPVEPANEPEATAEEGIEVDCGVADKNGNDDYFGVDANGNPVVLDVEFVRAPFDAGLSLLLGAGVIGGIKRARSRKQAANATV